MARPSKHIDKKLIEIGKKRLMEQGITSISIRSICLESGINLGMFHYYFKSKENYLRILFKGLSDDLQAYWIRESVGLPTSEEKLKKVLLLNTKIMEQFKGVFETIFKDVDIFDDFYRTLAKDLHQKWNTFFADLIDECKKDGYLDKTISTNKLISIIIGGVINFSKFSLEHRKFENREELYKEIQDIIDLLMLKFK